MIPPRALKIVNFLKKTASMIALIYSLVVVAHMILGENTKLSHDVSNWFAFMAMFLALVWLARVEGSQAAMVGLPPVDPTLFEKSHPIAFKVCQVGHKGDNLDRYLMGRQFIVLVLVFVINLAGTPADEKEIDYHTNLSSFLIGSGVALILITAMIGQLNSQVTASHCMLDYINNHAMTFTLYACLVIEASGLLHASYLIQFIFAWISQEEIPTNEPARNWWQSILFWAKILASTALLAFSVVIILDSLFEEKTSMWEGVPMFVSLVLFLGLGVTVGILEGMQIAFFAVSRMTTEERNINPWSRLTCNLLFKDEDEGGQGTGLASFLIGRQLLVATCFIVIARVTTPELKEGQDNILNFSDRMQNFLNTGLLGAFVTTILFSIAWQLVAAAFPVTFLGNPASYVLLRACLIVEATGTCSFVWVMSEVSEGILNYLDDVEHIGTAEERAAKGKRDNNKNTANTSRLAGGAFPANFGVSKKQGSGYESYSMQDLNDHMTDLKKQSREAKNDEERQALEREIDTLENAIQEHKKKIGAQSGRSVVTNKEVTEDLDSLDP